MQHQPQQDRSKQMARHALTCTSCAPHVVTITTSTNHLARMESLAAIEWCTYRKSLRTRHQ